MRKFYTNQDLNSKTVFLEEDYNHIVNVLRKCEGDEIVLFNNSGTDFFAKIKKINKKNIELEIINKKENLKENNTKITVFQALIKNDKLDLVVQKLTELNVDALRLYESEYTNVKTKEAKLDKLNKVSIESCKQCERSKSVDINFVGEFKKVLGELKAFDLVVFAYEKSTKELKKVLNTKSVKKNIAIVIGPEGGFSEGEKEELIKLENVCEVSLSKNILRSETASIMLSGILMYELN